MSVNFLTTALNTISDTDVVNSSSTAELRPDAGTIAPSVLGACSAATLVSSPSAAATLALELAIATALTADVAPARERKGMRD
eukprot:6212330-Pleurochrysis_carterae.AAC.2